MRISDWSSDVCSSDLNFIGRILTGRVQSGTVRVNQPIHAIDMNGKVIETGRASKLLAFRGLDRVPVEEARAGDIVAIAGLAHATVANTVADPTVSDPIPAQPIDPPTLSMRFAVNDSPMAGRERSEEHTSELQSLMRISYAVFCLKKKK